MKVRQDILLFAHLRAREDKNTMNRIMFYNKLDKYHLAHATDEWGKQYYNKLDNYYPSGKARYFYSKEEWDAYQREQQGKAQDNFKKQQEAKKTAEAKKAEETAKAGMTGYDEWKKEQKYQKGLKNQYKIYDVTKEQRESYNKNRDAERAEGEREETRRKNEAEASRVQAFTRRVEKEQADQDEINRIKAEGKENLEKKLRDQETERIKEEGKKNLEKKQAADKWERQQKEAQERVEKRERRAEAAKRDREARDAAIKKATESQQEFIKAEHRRLQAEEDARLKKEAEEQGQKATKEQAEKQKVINNYKTASNTELDQQYTATKNLIEQCNNSKDEIQFKLDNLLVDELKTEIASQDPEFISKWNGDLTNYLQPWNDGWYWFINGHDDSGHGKIANDALDKVVNKYKTAIDNTTYDDAKNATGTYLEKKKEEYDRMIESDIAQDIAKAKISLIKVHQGDSKKFEINDSLKKILENKLERIDDKYDGDLYDYIKPYFGLSFLPDNASYQNIEDILNEMEEELKSGKDPYGVYAEYYNNIRDAVYNA